MIQMDLLTKQKEIQTYKTNLWLPWGEGIVREFGKDMYTLLYFKWITSKNLLHSTGNSAQRYVAAWMGGEFGGEWVHMLEKGMAIHSNILAWRIPWTEEPGGLQFIGSLRVRHN